MKKNIYLYKIASVSPDYTRAHESYLRDKKERERQGNVILSKIDVSKKFINKIKEIISPEMNKISSENKYLHHIKKAGLVSDLFTSTGKAILGIGKDVGLKTLDVTGKIVGKGTRGAINMMNKANAGGIKTFAEKELGHTAGSQKIKDLVGSRYPEQLEMVKKQFPGPKGEELAKKLKALQREQIGARIGVGGTIAGGAIAYNALKKRQNQQNMTYEPYSNEGEYYYG